MLKNNFPREVGLPRKVVYNIYDYLKFINIHNGFKKAIYSSVYVFDTILQNGKPDYMISIVDKLFFDFDDKSCNAYEECNKLHKYLEKEKIKHHINMSGRGYHLFIYTYPTRPNNIKSCIYNAQHYFIDLLNLNVDRQVIGNPAQLARVPNTFNSKAQLFCIPLTKSQFELGDSEIKKLAIKQNFKREVIGEKLLELGKFDYKIDIKEDLKIDEEVEDCLEENYLDSCDEKIKRMLSRKNLGWRERFIVIMYFKENGFTIQEVYNILKDNLTEDKFRHCVNEERQLQYLFERDDLMFPERYGIKIYK